MFEQDQIQYWKSYFQQQNKMGMKLLLFAFMSIITLAQIAPLLSTSYQGNNQGEVQSEPTQNQPEDFQAIIELVRTSPPIPPPSPTIRASNIFQVAKNYTRCIVRKRYELEPIGLAYAKFQVVAGFNIYLYFFVRQGSKYHLIQTFVHVGGRKPQDYQVLDKVNIIQLTQAGQLTRTDLTSLEEKERNQTLLKIQQNFFENELSGEVEMEPVENSEEGTQEEMRKIVDCQIVPKETSNDLKVLVIRQKDNGQ